MVTKEALKDELDQMLTGIRERPPGLALVFSLPVVRRRLQEVAAECINLQIELVDASDDPTGLLQLQKKVIQLEHDYSRAKTFVVVMPAVLLLYVAVPLTWFGITSLDIGGFIKTTLGVEAPEKLITLGIAGAFLYLATSLLHRTAEISDKQVAGIVNFSVRLLMAVVVPIVIVTIFFTAEGKAKDLTLSPELLSFACGYSAKLVIDLFNKIVEKATNMIQAL